MKTIELVPGQDINGVENIRWCVVIAGDVHVQPAVGKLWRIDNADRCIGTIHTGRIRRMLVEELSECVKGTKDANARHRGDLDGT